MAIQEIKVNELRRSIYTAYGFTTGLTDLVVTVRLPNGDLLDPAPTVVEQGDGAYYIEYTPLTAGIYQEKWSSVVNSDYAVRGIKAVLYDLSDVKSAVDGIDTKVDAVALDVGSVKTTVEAVDDKVDAVATNVSSVKSTVEATDGKVDTINTNVASAKLTIESVDGKIDTQSSKLATIEGKIDDLDMQVVKGGYFIV
jgi:archaellum component FlaC